MSDFVIPDHTPRRFRGGALDGKQMTVKTDAKCLIVRVSAAAEGTSKAWHECYGAVHGEMVLLTGPGE